MVNIMYGICDNIVDTIIVVVIIWILYIKKSIDVNLVRV